MLQTPLLLVPLEKMNKAPDYCDVNAVTSSGNITNKVVEYQCDRQ